MLSLVEQAFVGRDEKRAPLKTPAWEAMVPTVLSKLMYLPMRLRDDRSDNAVAKASSSPGLVFFGEAKSDSS